MRTMQDIHQEYFCASAGSVYCPGSVARAGVA